MGINEINKEREWEEWEGGESWRGKSQLLDSLFRGPIRIHYSDYKVVVV